MTVTVNHAKTNAISDWTQAQLDEQIALGNFAPGTTLANIVLPSDWNDDHTFTGTLDVTNGGTGATTLTGYVKGSGTSAFTASASIPNTDISGLGTISTQDANNVAITGGSVNGTTIGATTASTGRFTTLETTGSSGFGTSVPTENRVVVKGGASAQCFRVEASTGGFANIDIHSDRTSGNLGGFRAFQGSDTQGSYEMLPQANKSATFFQLGLGTSVPTTQFVISRTASAVNYVQVTGATTGNQPSISAQGSDAGVILQLAAKGGSAISFVTNGVNSALQFQVLHTGSSVNYYQATGGAAGQPPRLISAGTDTNISMAFQPKGTGAIDLAAGSRGVNISNGGTVTAITRTSSGGSYTSIPSIAISAPTTAGGVQATASAAMFIQTVTIQSGGTGYTVGNTLTVVGGTSSGAATLRVDTVSSGVITAVTVLTGGTSYTALPTNPFSVTGGTGSGATFNVTSWAVSATITISNAGSGYIEQPTITFSGGGGSGAAAYANIGSSTIVRGLAATAQFHLPSGEAFRLSESGGTSVVGLNITNGSSNQNTVYMFPFGSATNPNTILGSKGTGFVGLFTGSNNDSNGIQQFRASHTASAVNYVQVTGATTGNRASISAQGSDSAVGLNYVTKSNGVHAFYTNSNSLQVAISHVASPVNYIDLRGSIATASPVISTAGSDTNIDLALTPKGTGLVRFGTYVAGALTATGYINIKAADGTTYKVLVST